ncbi:pre-mRNA-splicing factor 38B isoform X2 [Hydra vulgaris]|uniref:Pre-mRNA-splicing factor 38 n=1 Tax=Hydra vulgaris TaxID=6087 RepID=A0ABM4CJH1_HYDVU
MKCYAGRLSSNWKIYFMYLGTPYNYFFVHVDHLEPWEKGSRKTHGQVGMCGGVRGVGAGGIVSSGYCLLFKLFTLRLTEKQVYVLLNHTDSPYIRGMGFMFIRYCQHPNTFWDWFEPYLEDEEEIDPKAGGGCSMTIGQLVRSFLLKLDWYGTLFPRIPVPIHKEIEASLRAINLCDDRKVYADENKESSRERRSSQTDEKADPSFGEAEKHARKRRDEKSPRRSSDKTRTSSQERKDKDQRHSREHHSERRDSDRSDKRSSKDHKDHRSAKERRSSREKSPSRHKLSRKRSRSRDRYK